MNSIELLNNKDIRNFIYDDSNRKVLIASRRMGKTSALCYNIIKNSIGLPRDSVFLAGHNAPIEYMKDTLMNLSSKFDIQVECNKISGGRIYRVTIEQSNVYLMTWNAFRTSYRHLRVKDVYIDEPTSITSINLRELLTEVTYRTTWTNNDSKLVIAGSFFAGSPGILDDISSNTSFSRHIAKGEYAPEFLDCFTPEQYRAEILCENSR